MSLFLLFNLKTHQMKKSLLFLSMLLLFSLTSKAQFTTNILYETPDSQINLYIVSQGFTSSSMNKFDTYVNGYLDYMFGGNGNSGVAPYSDPLIKSRFRIIRVQVPSTTEHLPAAYFQFDHLPVSSLPPYISVPSSSPEFQQYTTTECISNFYQRMDNLKILLPGFNSKSYMLSVFNNNYYTGGGGRYCFVSKWVSDATATSSIYYYTINSYRVLLHEFSHTFGILGDEYTLSSSTPVQKDPVTCLPIHDSNGNTIPYYPDIFPIFKDRNVTPYTNATSITDSKIPWKYFINSSNPGVGVFDGANYSSTDLSTLTSTNPFTAHWFRSEQNCIMRSINQSYCKVCSALLNERIEEHLCKTDNIVAENFILRHQYITHWRKASNSLTSTSSIGNEITVKFISGNSISLSDGFSAVPGSDFYSKIGDCSTIEIQNTFRLSNSSESVCSHFEKPPQDAILNLKGIISVVPNPTNNFAIITSENLPIQKITIYSTDGKLIYSKKIENLLQYDVDVSNYSKGIYILSIETNNGNIISEKLIKN